MNRRIKKKIARRAIVFNQTAHKALWMWVAEEVNKRKYWVMYELKSRWPGWKSNGGDVDDARNACMACDYAVKFADKIRCRKMECNCCPLFRRGYDPKLGCLSGSYNDVRFYALLKNHPEQISKIAIKIANLPVKKGVKTI